MDTSDEEDTFSCGRCKEEFSSMDLFMAHKKSKICKKDGGPSSKEALGGNVMLTKPLQPVPLGSGVALGTDTNSSHSSVSNGSISYDAPETLKQLERNGNIFLAGKNNQPSITQTRLDDQENLIANGDTMSHDDIHQDDKIIEDGSVGKVIITNKEEINETFINCKFCSTPVAVGAKLQDHLISEHKISQEQVEQVASGMVLQKRKLTERKMETFSCDACEKQFKTVGSYKAHCKTKKHRDKTSGLTSNSKQPPPAVNAGIIKTESKVTNVGDENTVAVDDKDEVQRDRKRGRPRGRGGSKRKCPVCEKSYTSQAELVKHMKEDHPSDQPTEREKQPRRASLKLRNKQVLEEESPDEAEMDTSEEQDPTAEVSERSSGKKRKRTKKQYPEVCSICGMNIPAQSFSVHSRRCRNRQKYRCQLCKHQSRERYDFNIHMDHHKVWVEVDLQEFGDSPLDQENELDGEDGLEIVCELASKERDGNEGGTTLSEADLAALGLMPRSKLPQRKGTPEHSYASNDPETKSKEDARKVDVGSTDKKGSTGSTLKCHGCDRWFHRSILPTHMFKMHRMKKLFQCRNSACMKVFYNIDEFSQHVTSHPDDTMFCCGCMNCKKDNKGKIEEFNASVKRWKMRSYYRTLVYHCAKCWMRFPSQASLDRHCKVDSHNYPCEVCGKVQPSKRQLRTHMWCHQDKRAFLCEHCGRGFRTPRDLRKHVVSHGDDRPFECDKCGKGFVFKNKLDRHMTTVHSLVKPFVCVHPGCGKAFTRKDKLKDHMYTHNSTPPFMCTYCPKGFYRKDNLTDHEVYHTKQYRYTCNMCKKGFMRPKALKQHFAHDHPVNYGNEIAGIPEKEEPEEDTNVQIMEELPAARNKPNEVVMPQQMPQTDMQPTNDQNRPTIEGPTITHQVPFTAPFHLHEDQNAKSISQSLWNAQQISHQVNQLIQSMQTQQDGIHNTTMKASTAQDYNHMQLMTSQQMNHHPQQHLPQQQQQQHNPDQLKYNQQKLEQVTRQIQAVTQQLAHQLSQQLINQQMPPPPNMMQQPPHMHNNPPPSMHPVQHLQNQHPVQHPGQHPNQHHIPPPLQTHAMHHPQQPQHIPYTITSIHDQGPSVSRM